MTFHQRAPHLGDKLQRLVHVDTPQAMEGKVSGLKAKPVDPLDLHALPILVVDPPLAREQLE
jgi:hypothetical protein